MLTCLINLQYHWIYPNFKHIFPWNICTLFSWILPFSVGEPCNWPVLSHQLVSIPWKDPPSSYVCPNCIPAWRLFLVGPDTNPWALFCYWPCKPFPELYCICPSLVFILTLIKLYPDLDFDIHLTCTCI